MNKCIIDFDHRSDRNKAIDIALQVFCVSPLDITIKQRPVVGYSNRLVINFNDVYQTGAFINHITNDRTPLENKNSQKTLSQEISRYSKRN